MPTPPSIYILRDTRTGKPVEVAEPTPRAMTFPTWGDALRYARAQVDAQGGRTLEVREFVPAPAGGKGEA